MAYTCNNTVHGEKGIYGNWTPSSTNSWRYRVVVAYAVDSNSDGSATVYYRYYVETYGTVNSTLQSAYCGGGNWANSMAGTYLAGASGATRYYGTSCGANQYDYKLTLTRDGSSAYESFYVGHAGSTGTVYKTSVTFSYPSPKSVKFNANGGSGAPGTQTKYSGKTLILSSTKPTRSGYTFQGWATSSSGSVVYQPGGSYTSDSAVTLYAVWKANNPLFVANSSGSYRRATAIYVYNSSGAPRKATSITVYDSSGKPHTTKL